MLVISLAGVNKNGPQAMESAIVEAGSAQHIPGGTHVVLQSIGLATD